MVDLKFFLILSALLFGTGMAGVLLRRNALTVLMSVEIMLNAVNLAFLTFARLHNNTQGHFFALFVMAVAAAEAAVGLAIFINLFRLRETLHVDELNALKN